ncbi:helix-turn-helix domain-containing protein [Roseateles puraquae]|jgi:transcriptional regulator with XRE-family HTH domain|uniref:Transcriptional regulator n=1 Tax=Roseateles puraquae TaxID=431059 RepID=A0A254MZM4_9BURK|nr:transcriptional regulator [Roseateles puraquae]
MTARTGQGLAHAVFLDELVRLRMQAGLTPQELARRLGVKACVVTRAEAGMRRVGVVELQLWAFTCGSTLEDFGRRLDARIPQ